ncbi:MAG TPA: hypothetical protein VFZ91_06910 [Allosphingosinicella sp.]
MRMTSLAAAMALLAAAAPVGAADDEDDPDYVFFHKEGVTRDAAIADWEECRDLASAVEPPRGPSVYTPNVAAAAAAGFMQGLIRGAQRRHMFDAALRKCFQVKGYGRYETTKEESKLLYSGSWSVMRGKLADKATGPKPSQPALVP